MQQERRIEEEKLVAGIAQAGLRVSGLSVPPPHARGFGRMVWVPVRIVSGIERNLPDVVLKAVAAVARVPEAIMVDSAELGTIAVAVADALDAKFVGMILIEDDSDDRDEDIVSSLSILIDG